MFTRKIYLIFPGQQNVKAPEYLYPGPGIMIDFQPLFMKGDHHEKVLH
jgi:hypothetical protein